jgi:hypothetical protein
LVVSRIRTPSADATSTQLPPVDVLEAALYIYREKLRAA